MLARNFVKIKKLFSPMHRNFSNQKLFLFPPKHYISGRVLYSCSAVTGQLNVNESKINGHKPIPIKDSFYHYLSKSDRFKHFFFKFEPNNVSCNCKTLKILLEFENTQDTSVLEDLANCMKNELSTLSLNELLGVLFLFSNSMDALKKLQNWCEIKNELSSEMMHRHESFSDDEILKILSLLCRPALRQEMKFMWKMLFKFCKKLAKCNPEQVVFFFYIFKIVKNISAKELKFQLQVILTEMLPRMNLIDLGFITHVYARTKLKMTHPSVVPCLLKRMLEEIENVDSQTIEYLCNGIWIYSNRNDMQLIKEFQEKLIPYVPKVTTSALVSSASTGTKFKYVNSTLAEEVMKRVKNDIDQLQFLVIERFTFLNALFNIRDEEFLNLAISAVERNIEKIMTDNHITVIKFLTWLVPFKKYSIPISENVFSESLMKKLAKYNQTTGIWCLCFLALNLKLDMPQLYETLVDDTKIYNLWKVGRHSKSQLRSFICLNEKLWTKFFQFQKNLIEAYGEEELTWKNVIRHYNRHIIMRFDKNLKPQAIPEEYKTLKGPLIKPLNDNHIWICLILETFDYYNHLRNELNLFAQLEIRQLMAIGYKPIMIPYSQMKTCEDSTSFLQNKINEKLQEVLQESQQ